MSASSGSRYALTSRTQLEIGSKSRSLTTVIPYSISLPITLGSGKLLPSPGAPSEVLTRSAHRLDRALGSIDAADQRPHVDDLLALATGDARPVVGIRRVRQVLVFLELLAHRLEDVLEVDARLALEDLLLDRLLLGSVDDVLDHGAAREVLEVEDLALALRVRDLEELVLLVLRVHDLDYRLDHALHAVRGILAELDLRVVVQRQVSRQVLEEDLLRALPIRAVHLDLQVEAARAQHRRIDQILAVRRADHDHVAQRLDAVDLGEELRDDRGLHVRRDARAAHAEQRVHLVEEDDDGNALVGLLARVLEHLADLVLRLADVLVQELRTLHVQEVALHLGPAQLSDALGEAAGHRLADHGLAAARRAVEQDALRRRQVVLLERVGVQVRQLDRVAQYRDLAAGAAAVLVR